MAVRRICYAIMLVAAGVALVVTDSGIALFVLVCLCVLPAMSLVMLLLVRGRVKFDCEVRSSCIRGGALQITMRVGLSPRFAVGSAQVVAEIENTTFRKIEHKSFLFKDLSYDPHTYDYVGADSGRICARFTKIRLIDIFGIFALSVKCTEFAESVVAPVLYDDVQARLGTGQSNIPYGEIALPQKGSDISEIFNVRDYAAGDSLSAVHWKLSGKFDTLKSKEFGSTDDNRLLMLVDLSRKKGDAVASDEQLNAVLDVAASVSNALTIGGYSHNVGWFDNGVFARTQVADSNSYVQMINKLMSIKVNDGDAETLYYLSRSPEALAFTKVILVSATITNDELNCGLKTNITAISVCDNIGEVDEKGVKIINVPYDDIRAALASCVL